MRKRASLFIILGVIPLLILLIINSIPVCAEVNLEITAKPISNNYIIGLEQPAIFDLIIQNKGESGEFEIFSLVGVDISPETPFIINKGDTKILRIELRPGHLIRPINEFFTFEYIIKNKNFSIQKEQLTIRVVELENSFSIIPSNINPNSEIIPFSLKNRLDSNFTDLNIKITSAFFDYETGLDLAGLETKILNIKIDKEKLKTLNAGEYLITTQINVYGKTVNLETFTNFLKQEGIESYEIKEGFMIQRQEIYRKNIGNIKKTITITSEKSLFAYLFTSTNQNPTSSKINLRGFKKQYVWEKQLIPNEEIKIIIKTNWYYPFLALLLIVFLIILIKKFAETDLVLRKKVSFVKTKGGQFALKITLRLKSKKFIERIKIIDKIPSLVKIYERFGAVKPDKIDTSNRRLEWDIQYLNKGEERIFTYIIYSRIGVVGRFELPEAKTVYERDGKVKQTTSNRSFYINEPMQ